MIDDIGKPFVEINVSTGEIQAQPRSVQAVHREEGKGDDEQCRDATGKRQPGGRHQRKWWAGGREW